MINKKNLLGKTPEELGDKDAIHTAIVSVRAGCAIEPGQKCKLNDDREAVPAAGKDSVGVADPFLKNTILRGQPFWLLLAQDEVPNVKHVWEHPTVDFTPPDNPVKKNRTIQDAADLFAVTYEQIMTAANYVIKNDKPAPYPGELTLEDLNIEDNFDSYEFWSEWGEEVNYEFENYGSACCPEYQHPECELFKKI